MASFKSSTIALLGAFAAKALAHGMVTSFSTDGQEHGGFILDYYYEKVNGGTPPAIAAWSAENLDSGFVDGTKYQAVDINCHKKAAPGAETVSVAAGGTVEFQWTPWQEGHFGPVFTYVAKCEADCSAADPATLKWVKIDEAGIDADTQTWAAVKLSRNDNKWTTKVPATLAPGNYVFRHEIIAMHAAGSVNGAQNYPQCFNIAITGSGTENPEGVLGTELYTADHPGIHFNPYTTITNYDIPGPALYGSGGNSGGSGSGNATPVAPVTPVTPAPVESELPVTPAPSAAAPSAPASSAPAAPAPSAPAAPAPSAPAIPSNGTAPVDDTPTECPVAARRRARRAARAARRHSRDLF